jgi:flagellar hook-associated protein 3 FlgL
MRITENRLLGMGTQASARARRELFEAADELSSGQRVDRPSDDPGAWARGQRLSARLTESSARGVVHQAGRDRLVETDLRLDEMSDILTRGRELALQLSNGTMSAAERAAATQGLAGMRESLRAAMNARDSNGGYLFSGSRTDTEPFDAAGTYFGDTVMVLVTTDASATVGVNVTGSDLTSAGGINPLAAFDALTAAAGANDVPGLRAALQLLGESGDHLAFTRSQVGHRMGLMEQASEIREDQKVVLAQGLALAVGADDLSAAERLARARSALETASALSETLASVLRR